MGSSSSEDEDGGLLQRPRNARSLDIDRSCRTSREASKAAAWMWHMHSSPSSKTKEIKEKPASPSDYTKRRSTSCDRKDSRFRQEAATSASASTSTPKPVTDQSPSCKLEQEANVWDCGSKLYDTFELVSFSNRLDRSLLDIPAFNALNYPPAQSPLHHRGFAGVLRTFSLPRTLSTHNYSSMPSVLPPPPPHVKPSSHVETSSSAIRKHASPADLQGTVAASAARIDRKPSASWHVITNKWTLSKLTNILKKVKTLHKHIQCFRPRAVGSHDIRRHELMDDEDGNGMPDQLKYRTYEEKVNEGNGGKHFHHHHHHYHHHFVHHNIDQLSPAAKEENVCKPRESVDRNGSTCAVWFGQRAESARLSSDTLFKICADVNWL